MKKGKTKRKRVIAVIRKIVASSDIKRKGMTYVKIINPS